MARDLDHTCRAWGLESRGARERDETISYEERAMAAFEWQADLAICHHVNAIFDDKGNPRRDVDGLMCFAPMGDNLALEVGSAIMRAAPAALLRRKHRAIPTSPHDHWTRDTHAIVSQYRRKGIPAVLVEWGFATSPRDLAVLTAPESRPALVAAGMAGVARYLELVHSEAA